MKISGYLTRGADGLTTTMNRHSSEMAKSIERLSSGSRINHSGDDSAGKAISERMRSQIRSLDQSQQNTQNANALLGIADAAVTSIVDVLQQMKTLAIQASSDDVTGDEREAIQMELDQLRNQVDHSALMTSSGRYLLDGSFGELQELVTYESDNTTVQNYKDKEDETKTFNDLSFRSLKWENGKGMYFQVGPDRNDTIMAHLGNMNADHIFKDVNITVSTTENAMKLSKALDKSLTRALYQQVEIGTLQERLEITANNLQEISDDTTAALSTLQDTDMAKEMTNFVTHNMLMQATQAMMAQANSNIDNFISLVRPQG